jgi:hypothetical protein
MTSRQEIQQTLRDCKYESFCTRGDLVRPPFTDTTAVSPPDHEAKNGFEAAHTWKSDLGQEFLKEYGRE